MPHNALLEIGSRGLPKAAGTQEERLRVPTARVCPEPCRDLAIHQTALSIYYQLFPSFRSPPLQKIRSPVQQKLSQLCVVGGRHQMWSKYIDLQRGQTGGKHVCLTRQPPLLVPSNQGNPLNSAADFFCKSAATKGCIFRPHLPLPGLQERAGILR